MNRKIFAVIGFLLIITPVISAAQVIYPNRGGTGTTTIPSVGDLLVGYADGTYGPRATSSLGLVGAGTVTSVGLTAPTGFSVTNSPITASGVLGLAFNPAYYLPLVASSTEWATAYGWGDHSLAGYLTDITAQSITNLSDVNTTGANEGDVLTLQSGVWADADPSSLALSGGDGLATTSIDTEAELEAILTDVTNVFTNNDGALDDDDVSQADVTAHEAALTITESQISDLDHYNSTDFTTDLATKDTDDLSEGTNLYYTLARVQSAIAGGYNAIFGNATSTNQAISGNLTFGGVTGSAWSDFCVSITGGSGLCDGTDATGGGGGGGLATSTDIADTEIIYGTSVSDVGSEAAFTYNDATNLLTAVNGTFSGTLTADLTGNADTATALASNPANCSSGSAPLGVDASGAVESCFDVWTEAENTSAAYISGNETITLSGDITGSGATAITTAIGSGVIVDADVNASADIGYSKLSLTDSILEADLKAVDTAADEECLTYETTTGDFEWQTCGGGGGLADVVDDTTPQLGGTLDALSEQILSVGKMAVGTSTATRLLDIYGDYSGGIAQFNRTPSGATDAAYGVLNVKATHDANMGTGFGSAIQFFIEDNAGVENDIASIQATRQNVDDSGYLDFYTTKTGTPSVALTLTPDGGTTFYNSVTVPYDFFLDSTPDTDSAASGNVVKTIYASTTIAAGDIVHLNTVGAWELADADATSTSQGMVGVAFSAATNGTLPKVALNGAFVRFDTWNWPIGVPLYLDPVAGDATTTPPTASGDVVRRIGYSTSADELYIDVGEVILLQ